MVRSHSSGKTFVQKVASFCIRARRIYWKLYGKIDSQQQTVAETTGSKQIKRKFCTRKSCSEFEQGTVEINFN